MCVYAWGKSIDKAVWWHSTEKILTWERAEVTGCKEGFIMTKFLSFTIHLILYGLLIWENKSVACGMYGTDEDHTGKLGVGDRVVF